MQIKNAIDITDKWINTNKNGKVTYIRSYIYNGNNYKVDNFHVVLKPTKEELEISELLANRYGKDVYILPRINVPQNIQTPDYLINGKKYDLKSPHGSGRQNLINQVKRKERQSHNFIFSFKKSLLSKNDINRQLSIIINSEATKFIQTIVIIEYNNKITVYKRKTGNYPHVATNQSS